MRAASISLVLLIQGCSSAQVYEGVRISNQRDCSQYQGTAYDECMEQYEDNFQRYDIKRRQIEQLDQVEQTDQADQAEPTEQQQR